MKDKWAIIDDIRELNCDFIAKTGHEGITMMTEHFEEIGTLCMDHDLGDADDMNGFQVLELLMFWDLVPDHVQLVTSNPVGRTNMSDLLRSKSYQSKDGINFRK
jgi:hypothetical protein